MSTSINTTQQQDRVAQKHLASARQQATAQGPLPGANGGKAFAQLLSLACDEDTDLDARKLNGGPTELATPDGENEPDLSGKARRKTGLDASDATGDSPVPDTLHPTAQSNAVLLALLDRAARGETADTSPGPGTAAPLAAHPTDTTTAAPGTKTAVAHDMPGEQAAGQAGAQGAGALSGIAIADTASNALPAELAPQPAAPGKAVRDLARQLSAQRHNQELAQTLAQTPAASHAGSDAPRGLGVAWGRSVSDAAGAAAPSNGAPSTELASNPSGQTSPQSWHMSHAGQPGSRLNNNTSTTSPDATPEDITAVAGERPTVASSPAANAGGQAQTGLGGETLGGADFSELPPSQDALAEPGEQWQQQWSEAMEQVAQQVSYWAGGGGMRQATLRVGNGQLQAMDVKLSLKNGQADIEFRTNHEDARNAIAQGGAEVLRNLLASSGIDLGSVFVGGQSAGSQGQESASATQTPQPFPAKERGGQAAAGSEALLSPLNELRPRNASSVGLDVYV